MDFYFPRFHYSHADCIDYHEALLLDVFVNFADAFAASSSFQHFDYVRLWDQIESQIAIFKLRINFEHLFGCEDWFWIFFEDQPHLWITKLPERVLKVRIAEITLLLNFLVCQSLMLVKKAQNARLKAIYDYLVIF